MLISDPSIVILTAMILSLWGGSSVHGFDVVCTGVPADVGIGG
jgi:hypothetical protein